MSSQFPLCTGFIKRIIDWNKARYAQEFNHELAYNLLHEELGEFLVASEDVDRLDALIDIVYVAIGAIWKLGLDEQQIRTAIHIVCSSNESKSVAKTASHIKANGTDKGPNYFKPEPFLQEVLNAQR